MSNRILVIGIGGMGGHALRHLTSKHNPSCPVLLVDTDEQALSHSSVRYKMLLGKSTLQGLGTGRNVAAGKEAAARSIEQFRPYLNDSTTVCIMAGLGGGTGSGATQVIARYALDLGKKVVCIVSTPFRFEGQDAEIRAIEALRELDHIGVEKVVLNNQDLFAVAEQMPSFSDAFTAADEAASNKVMDLLEHGSFTDDTLIALAAGGC